MKSIVLKKRVFAKFVVATGFFVFVTSMAFGQMKRERTTKVDREIFLAGSIITLPSVTQLPASNLNFTIQHAFGPISDGFKELFGLDASSNIRFGLDYGVTDNISVGIGRSRFDKVYDARVKAKIATFGDAQPTVVSVFGNLGIDSQDNGADLSDRASSHISVLLARSINEKLSIQLSPAWSHFNTANENIIFGGGIEKEEKDLVSLGIATRYALNNQVSILAEYIPVVGSRSDGSEGAFSLGVDLEAGGHVFQIFLTSTQWIAPQYVVSKSRNNFFDGDFGFGFNIHRVF